MVCCPTGEVSGVAACDINGDQKSSDKKNDISIRRIKQMLYAVPVALPVCGSRSTDLVDVPRIAEGENAPPGDWPWMALIGYERPGSTEPNFACGGTLISLKICFGYPEIIGDQMRYLRNKFETKVGE